MQTWERDRQRWTDVLCSRCEQDEQQTAARCQSRCCCEQLQLLHIHHTHPDTNSFPYTLSFCQLMFESHQFYTLFSLQGNWSLVCLASTSCFTFGKICSKLAVDLYSCSPQQFTVIHHSLAGERLTDFCFHEISWRLYNANTLNWILKITFISLVLCFQLIQKFGSRCYETIW